VRGTVKHYPTRAASIEPFSRRRYGTAALSNPQDKAVPTAAGALSGWPPPPDCITLAAQRAPLESWTQRRAP
jgi:hypothetical protein